MEELEVTEVARKYALANAFEFQKASSSSVVGKVISNISDSKKDMKLVMKIVNEQVNLVNGLTAKQIEEELKKYSFEQKKVEEDKSISIQQAIDGEVSTRFPPEPSAYPHIGHAKAAFLSSEIAKKYHGKFILRFDDTNPENESQDFVDAIKDGLKWLGLEYTQVFFASDYMPQMYDFALKLINDKNAYVCTCNSEKVKESRQNCKRCSCPDKSIEEQISQWNKMINGEFDEAEAILRFFGKIDSENTAMRDPTLYRILKTTHFRQMNKYVCWPTYDFEGAVLDSYLGTTHALRSKEYELRDELYKSILEKLNLRIPYLYDFSRLNLKGTLISKRLIKPLIATGKVTGWNDPRLPTILGLKRRGILPQAIKNYVLSFGLSKVESKPNWNALLNENKKLLDPIAKRYFFVINPIELIVENHPQEISHTSLKTHPTNEEFGKRILKVNRNFFISKNDLDSLKIDEVVRLKDLYNIQILKIQENKVIGKFVGNQAIEGKKLHWLPNIQGEFKDSKLIQIGDLVDDKDEFNENSLTEFKGIVEKSATTNNTGTFVQFERVGFAIYDSENDCSFIKCE